MAEDTRKRVRSRILRAEAEFKAELERRGWELCGPYANARTPVEVRCNKGHLSAPLPGNIMSRGQGCRACKGRDPEESQRKYLSEISRRGWTLLDVYQNTQIPLRVECENGHLVSIAPCHVLSGRGCRICKRCDSAATGLRFAALVQAQGGELIGPYVNDATPVEVICRAGHSVFPRPNNVLNGKGICRRCAGKSWDVFYVTQDPDYGSIKFGVTSGDPRPRLSRHAGDGFTTVLRLHTDLPGTVAPDLERQVLAALRDARMGPVKGREYFAAPALGLVLDLVDGHLGRP